MAERADGVNRFLGRRPLAMLALCYALGALCGYYASLPPLLLALLGLALAVALALKRRVIFVYLAVMMLAGSVTQAVMRVPSYAPREKTVIAGRVIEAPQWDGRRSVTTLDSVTIGSQPHPHPLRVYQYGEALLARAGDQIRFTGDTWLPKGQTNPGGFDFRRWLWARGGALCATVSGAAEVREAGLSPLMLPGRARAAAGERIDHLFPDQAPLVRALVLGDKGQLTEDMISDFRESGLAHLLAVSGLHVSCLALALELLLRLLGCTKKAALGVTTVLLVGYSAMIGFPASVVRAGLMFLCVRGAPLFGRPNDTLTGLSFAALMILMLRPQAIGDIGFQLSFAAILGILLLREPLLRLTRAPRAFRWPGLSNPGSVARWLVCRAANMVIVSLATLLSTLPIISSAFGYVGAMSVLTNLVAIPLATLALPLAVLKLLLGAGWFTLPDLLLRLLTGVAGGAASVRLGAFNLPVWPAWLTGAYFALMVLASPYVRVPIRRRKWVPVLLPALAVASVLIAWARLPGGLSLAFLDAGQADAAQIRAEGRAYLVDTGKDDVAMEYLVHTAQAPEAVFLTHPHEDHTGGLMALVKRMDVAKIYVPECWDRVAHEGDVDEAIALAVSRGTKLIRLSAGDVVQLSERVRATVVRPVAGEQPASGNAASMVLLIEYGDGSALLTGDLPGSVPLLDYPDVDVLKAPHHGSGADLTEGLLVLTRPSVLVISVGNNGYGHPSEAAMGRAQALGASVYRTDRSGAVFAQIGQDGGVIVRPFLEDGA